MSKGIVTKIFHEQVAKSLYNEMEAQQTMIVKMMCRMGGDKDSDMSAQELSFQTNSPEEARRMAMEKAAEMGRVCTVSDVVMVPNSDEKLHKLGNGKSINPDSDATKGQVMPSDVSKGLDNQDA